MLVINIIKGVCPRCHKGKIFQNPNPFSFKLGKMNEECPNCKLDFTKETGFYWGAMFVSYALATIEIFLIYALARILGTGKFDILNLWIVIGGILLLSPFNFKISRIIWLYIFPGD